jgi:hypothetical protein
MTLKIKRTLLYINILLNILCIAVIIANNLRHGAYTIHVKDRIEDLHATDEKYKQEKARYLHENDSLQSRLKTTDSLLQIQNKRQAVLEYKVREQASENWKNLPVEIHLEKCDSLKETVKQYEEYRQYSDSLITQWKINTNFMLADREKQISDCDQSYQQVKETLERTISDSQDLQQNEKRLERKLKRQKIFSHAIIFGAAMLSAIATTIIISHGK